MMGGPVIVGSFEFDVQPQVVIVGWIEFDVGAPAPVLQESPPPSGLGYRRSTRSVTTISSPLTTRKRYDDEHSYEQELARIAAAELADEEIVLAFVMELAHV